MINEIFQGLLFITGAPHFVYLIPVLERIGALLKVGYETCL